MFLSKYGAARHIYIPMVKRAVVDHAVSADWTPAAGDVKISKSGGAAANVTNLPSAIAMGNSTIWDFSLTATEMQAAQIMITIADSATKAIEDSGFIIETYGNASAQHAVDLSDGVRAGLTALPNAAASAVGGLPVAVDASGRVDVLKVNGTSQTARDIGASVLLSAGTGAGQLDFTSGVVKANLAQILGTALTETAGQIAAGFKKFFNVASPAMDVTSVNQTGDSYARVGAAGAGLTALGDTRIAHLDADVSTRLATSGYTAPPSAATIAQAVWDVLTSALSTVGSIGKLLVTNVDAAISTRSTYAGGDTAGTTTLLSRLSSTRAGLLDNLDATVSSRLASGAYTAPDNASIAAIKTKTDSLTFTVAGMVDSNVVDWKGATAPSMTGDAYARLGAPAGASVSADVAAAKVDTVAIKSKTDNLPASPAAVGSAMTLSSGERTTLAAAIEAAIIDDSDGEAVLTAITNKIASVDPNLGDLSLSAIASAVRTELTVELAHIDADISSRLAAVDYTAPDNATVAAIAADVTDVKAQTDQLSFSTAGRVDSQVFGMETDTVTAGAVAASAVAEIQSGLSTLSAAGIRTAVGLASADLDTQLSATKAVVDAIKGQTDGLVFTVAGKLDVNVLAWKGATAPAMTGDAYARLGAPAGASMSADVAAAKTDTAAIKAVTDQLPDGGALTGLLADIAAIGSTANDIDSVTGSLVLTAGKLWVLDDQGNALRHSDELVDDFATLSSHGDATWGTATGFSTHSAADVWSVAVRVLTASTNLDDLNDAVLAVLGTPAVTIADDIAAISAGSGPSAADIAAAVWDEPIADHSGTSGSTAEQLAAAGAAGDPWATALPGPYGAGTAGKIVGDRLDAAVSSRLATVGYTAPDNADIAAIKARTDALPADPADASDIAAAFGAVNAALATIASYVDTEVGSILSAATAIKAKTDNLPASPAAAGDVPSAADVATAVRSELDDELDHVTELWQLEGLDAAHPMTVTPSTRAAGDIAQAITGNGETTTTVTRAA